MILAQRGWRLARQLEREPVAELERLMEPEPLAPLKPLAELAPLSEAGHRSELELPVPLLEVRPVEPAAKLERLV